MRLSPQRLLWFFLALAVVLAVVWQLAPIPDASRRLADLPSSGWRISSRDVPLTPTEAAIFGKARVVKRLYQVGGQRVLLLAIDGTRERHAVHDPLYCFRGAGWEVLERRDQPVPGGEARRIVLGRGGARAEAFYWISDSRTRHASAFRAWMQSTSRRLSLGYSGGEPVLFLLQPVSGEAVDWARFVAECPDLFRI